MRGLLCDYVNPTNQGKNYSPCPKEPKEIRFNNAWDSTVRWRSGTAENESDLMEVAVTWPITQTVTLFWTVTLFVKTTEPWPGGWELSSKKEAYASRKIRIKTESIRKLSNFNFQCTKTLYQNNLNNIAFFSTFFKGYDVISYL